MCYLEYAGLSDQGSVRYRNEDFITYHLPTDPDLLLHKGCLFAVADGVGGSNAGDVASREAAEILLSAYYGSRHPPARALREAFVRANQRVYDLGLSAGSFHMETTLVALALVGDKAFIAHVGDSRLYRVRDAGRAEALTQDHSEVAEMIRMKLLRPEQARTHPRRHIITRSLGSALVQQPVQRTEKVTAGEIFVLCTDGIWEPIEEKEMAQIVMAYSPAESCRRLLDLGLARQATDNLSAQVIKVLHIENSSSSLPETRAVPWWQRPFRSAKEPNE
jgi:serine/threonine protein phosphatase PrpC